MMLLFCEVYPRNYVLDWEKIGRIVSLPLLASACCCVEVDALSNICLWRAWRGVGWSRASRVSSKLALSLFSLEREMNTETNVVLGVVGKASIPKRRARSFSQ